MSTILVCDSTTEMCGSQGKKSGSRGYKGKFGAHRLAVSARFVKGGNQPDVFRGHPPAFTDRDQRTDAHGPTPSFLSVGSKMMGLHLPRRNAPSKILAHMNKLSEIADVLMAAVLSG